MASEGGVNFSDLYFGAAVTQSWLNVTSGGTNYSGFDNHNCYAPEGPGVSINGFPTECTNEVAIISGSVMIGARDIYAFSGNTSLRL